MNSGVQALSEKEKQTLRLLLRGHDSKSIAVEQGLSVHTVHERLRECRKKLGVSSSREAARRLAEFERAPENLGDKQLGVATGAIAGLQMNASDRPPGAVREKAWLIGGILVMSLIIAAVLLTSSMNASEGTAPAVAAAATGSAQRNARSPAVAAAHSWVSLVDAGKLEESWKRAGAMFRSQISAPGWTASVQPVRAQVGSLVTRKFKSAEAHNSLPGAPAGQYEIVQFDTSFTKAKSTVETVVLARERSGWKVVGYFVRPAYAALDSSARNPLRTNC